MELRAGRSGVVQVAYQVVDVRSAALSHSATFGSGPFFVADHIPLQAAEHRGQPARFDHSSAYGQWGPVMVELVAIHGAQPEVLARETRLGEGRIHHLARFVDDLDAESDRLERFGYPQILLARTGSGQRFAFHDGRDLGHLLEIYEPTPALVGFYARIAAAADGWDGTDPVSPVGP